METNYKRGRRKEYKILERMRNKGCLAFRSAGSHSPVDVFSLNEKTQIIHLIQSKPESMSSYAKLKILNDLKRYEGIYQVIVSVE